MCYLMTIHSDLPQEPIYPPQWELRSQLVCACHHINALHAKKCQSDYSNQPLALKKETTVEILCSVNAYAEQLSMLSSCVHAPVDT